MNYSHGQITICVILAVRPKLSKQEAWRAACGRVAVLLLWADAQNARIKDNLLYKLNRKASLGNRVYSSPKPACLASNAHNEHLNCQHNHLSLNSLDPPQKKSVSSLLLNCVRGGKFSKQKPPKWCLTDTKNTVSFTKPAVKNKSF